ncbi:MAG: ribonuclease H [Dehalococcoidia bacterium]
MTSPRFTCERCGDAFELPAATLAKYPNWTPKLCMRCRGAGGSKAPRGSSRLAGGRGGLAPASGGPRGNSATRSQLLTTAQILERYVAGPDTGVFTDGSCSGNPGPGGWGAVRVEGGRVVVEEHGAEAATTNNRMELTAMIAGLRMLGPGEAGDVYSDSRLVVQTLTQWAAGWERRGWKRTTGEVKNLELVQEAYALAKARPRARIQWIRAHDGSRWNEYADALSTAYLRSEV